MTRYEYFSDLWAQGDVYVVVMLNHPDVVVPEFIRAQGKETETFVLGLTPSPKLTADEGGITAPMRFNSYFFDCYFPWDGILAILNDDVQIAFKPSAGPKPVPAPEPAPEKTKKPKSAKSGKVVPLRRIK
ncbi:MAG: hypothetical protein OEV28_08895 [Nitrospirota bacterium]|nr:hypothetical protein [Nitrospirota bacterium]